MLCTSAGWFLGQRSASAPQEQTDPASSPGAGSEGGLQGGEFIPLDGENELNARYPVNFPQSVEGAVSAAFHGLQNQSTNDLEALTAVMNTYYKGEYDQEDVQVQTLDERELELSLREPDGYDFDGEAFPGPYSYHYVEPIGVHWEIESRTEVEVFLLLDIRAGDGEGMDYRDRDLTRNTMAWSSQDRGGDWIVEQITGPTLENRPAPEEYELEHEAWTPLADPQRRGA